MSPSETAVVNTVTGPIDPSELGIVAIHEALLSVVPGAQYAYDIDIDRAEIFDILAAKLEAFRIAGGGTVVDASGMFHGRDLRLYEALSRASGVHIIASTGMGPEEQLGGYFLTPQTNPPTPWPADRFAELFSAEATEGMVVPRLERRGLAGLIVTAVTRDGATPTDESLLRGAARAALVTGVPLSFDCGGNALAELQIAVDEGLPASRIIVAGVDRADVSGVDRAGVSGVDRADVIGGNWADSTGRVAGAAGLGLPQALLERGVNVAFDHVGWNDSLEYAKDEERIRLLGALIAAGYGDRLLVSSSAIGVAKGLAPRELPYEHVINVLAPLSAGAVPGLTEADLQRILVDNPARLLTVTPDSSALLAPPGSSTGTTLTAAPGVPVAPADSHTAN